MLITQIAKFSVENSRNIPGLFIKQEITGTKIPRDNRKLIKHRRVSLQPRFGQRHQRIFLIEILSPKPRPPIYE
jgi:hypothetical protein